MTPLVARLWAQDAAVPRRADYRPHAPRPELEDDRWLEWFLRNHDPKPLVDAGAWMATKFIVADLRDTDVPAVVRAAFAMDGPDGAWSVLVPEMKERLPGCEGVSLPEGWADRPRYYRERWDAPTVQLVGRFQRDR